MIVLDTDVVIRYLTNDDPDKANRFEQFLDSDTTMVLTAVTFAEIYWTLHSFYDFPKSRILTALEALVHHPTMQCQKAELNATIELMRGHNISLIDAYAAVTAIQQAHGKVLSYDKGFDRLPGISRIEP